MSEVVKILHPGKHVLAEIKSKGWSQVEFAEILEVPIQSVSRIIRGISDISPRMAKILAAGLGMSPEYWMGLQTAYDLSKASKVNVERIRARAEAKNKKKTYTLAEVKKEFFPNVTIEQLEGKTVPPFRSRKDNPHG